MSDLIHDRGRGPEIFGTRVTVYNILDHEAADSPEAIAAIFRLELAQVHAALAYINDHRDELMIEYRKMLARDEAGNSPEIRAKLIAVGVTSMWYMSRSVSWMSRVETPRA